MCRLLITLRHPGPTQAIASLFPNLKTRYDQVAVAASDTALLQLQGKYYQSMQGIDLYYSQYGVWRCFSKTREKETTTRGDSLEFKSPYENGYIDLVSHFANLLKDFHPDIVLRTTPSLKWGLDEALVDACRQAGLACAYRCYQEYYGCGVNLESFPYAVATIDDYAQALLIKKRIPSTVTGWLNQAVFNSYRPYWEARAQTRMQLGLTEKDSAVLYCAVASGNINAEVEHFRLFLQAANNSCVYIKFHPRNQPCERSRYWAQVGDQAVFCVDSFSMDGVLAFPDFMVSATSAINLDMLEYQVMTRLSQLHGVSVFTKGATTESILLSAIGEKSVPIAQPGMGSFIVDEESYDHIFKSTTNRQKTWLYDCAKQIFDSSADKSIQRFLDYLEGI